MVSLHFIEADITTVSAGVYGWPKDDAIAAAIETISESRSNVESATLVAFDHPTYNLICDIGADRLS